MKKNPYRKKIQVEFVGIEDELINILDEAKKRILSKIEVETPANREIVDSVIISMKRDVTKMCRGSRRILESFVFYDPN